MIPDVNLGSVLISKAKASNALGGDVLIQQINDQGEPIDTWTLKNAWIISVDFGGSLDYTSDEMTELTVELSYDWAEYTKGSRVGAVQI